MLVRCLKHKIRSHGHLNHQFFPLHPFPKIGHIPKDCLKEHLQGLGLVAEEDFRHFLSSFLHVCKLERCHLPLHISKRILHSTEFRCMRWGADHFQSILLHDSHNEGTFMCLEVVMLEHQQLIRILRLHLFHQFREVVIIGLVGLSPSGYELNLLTAMATDAHGASQILPQVLLVPLQSKQAIGKFTSTL